MLCSQQTHRLAFSCRSATVWEPPLTPSPLGSWRGMSRPPAGWLNQPPRPATRLLQVGRAYMPTAANASGGPGHLVERNPLCPTGEQADWSPVEVPERGRADTSLRVIPSSTPHSRRVADKAATISPRTQGPRSTPPGTMNRPPSRSRPLPSSRRPAAGSAGPTRTTPRDSNLGGRLRGLHHSRTRCG